MGSRRHFSFDYIRKALLSGCDSINLCGLSRAEAFEAPRVWQAVLLDEPRLLRLNGRATTRYLGDTPVELTLGTYYDYKEEQYRLHQIDTIVGNLLSKMQAYGSPYEKAEIAYRSIIAAVDYNSGIGNSQTMDSVFLQRQSSCSGYSHALQYVLNRAGIPCAYINGTTRDGVRHAWNLVSIDGHKGWVDVTWGDPIMYDTGDTISVRELDANNPNSVRMDYFCVPDKEFRTTHTPNADIDKIVGYVDDGNLDWYKTQGLWFDDDYNRERVANAVQTDLLKREVLLERDTVASISLKFVRQNAFQEAWEDLFTRGGLLRLASPVFAAYEMEIMGNVYLSPNTDLKILHFSFLKQHR